jgi:hypothetical protein
MLQEALLTYTMHYKKKAWQKTQKENHPKTIDNSSKVGI